MKNTVCIFFSDVNSNKILSIYKNVIKEISSNLGKVYLVNFYNIENNINHINHEDIEEQKSQNFENICPQNLNDLNKFLKDRFIFAFDSLGRYDIKSFKVKYLISRKNIKLLQLQYIGYFGNQTEIKKNISNKNLFFLIKRIFVKKLHRAFVFFKIFSPIFLNFECRKDIAENCINNEKKNKILENFFNYSFFEKTIKINSRAYDNFKNSDYEISNDKIIFLDGNYKHSDIIKREYLDLSNIKIDYFNRLKICLDEIGSIFNKKVEICLHPKSEIHEYKHYFKDYIISQYETEKKIFSASIIIFHESSAIDNAIFLNKRIISLKTNIFGNYFSHRIKKYIDMLNTYSINIDKKLEIDKREINQLIKIDTNMYENYKKNYLVSNELEAGSETITKCLIYYFNKLDK
jgi:hypothetical protein